MPVARFQDAADGACAPSRDEVTGLVLCGGASRRMGRDKARLELDGRTLLERAVATVDPLAAECVLACGAEPRYAELGLRLALDEVCGAGPLAGLAAGLAAARTRWVVALACDLPGVGSEHLGALLALAAHERADLALLAGPRGVEPLCGVYHRRCLAPVREALARGERRMVSFWTASEALRVAQIRADDLAGAGRDEALLLNLNTPADLRRAARAAAAADAQA